MIKLIASDVDGTFFDSNHEYNHERFNKQLELLHQSGVKFAIASGNYYGHLEEVLKYSPVDAFIAQNGAQIIVDGKEIFGAFIDSDVVKSIINHMDEIADDVQNFFISGEKASYINKEYYPMDDYFVSNFEYVDNINTVDDNIFKINIRLKESNLQHAMDKLNELYKGRIHATPSGYGNIDIIPVGIDKGFGLKKLAEIYGISMDEIAAFGDNNNDLEMIEEVGTGISMKNGTKETLSKADRVTRFDNDHEGVLETIDELFDFHTDVKSLNK